jgi:hypothetical protein
MFGSIVYQKFIGTVHISEVHGHSISEVNEQSIPNVQEQRVFRGSDAECARGL